QIDQRAQQTFTAGPHSLGPISVPTCFFQVDFAVVNPNATNGIVLISAYKNGVTCPPATTTTTQPQSTTTAPPTTASTLPPPATTLPPAPPISPGSGGATATTTTTQPISPAAGSAP